jgi:CBS domain-containing protein
MTIESIMTSKPAVCGLTSNLAEVAQVMWEGDCGCVPIVDDARRVIGMVTDRDICIAASTKDRPPSRIQVSELPRADVIVCRPDDAVSAALALMRTRRVRRLPVTAPDGELVGIVTLNDAVLAAGGAAGISAADVLEAMQGICSHGTPHAVAVKAAGA